MWPSCSWPCASVWSRATPSWLSAQVLLWLVLRTCNSTSSLHEWLTCAHRHCAAAGSRPQCRRAGETQVSGQEYIMDSVSLLTMLCSPPPTVFSSVQTISHCCISSSPTLSIRTTSTCAMSSRRHSCKLAARKDPTAAWTNTSFNRCGMTSHSSFRTGLLW